MSGMIRGCVFTLGLIALSGLSGQAAAQAENRQMNRAPLAECDPNEVAAMKADLSKMQSLLNQMQAVFNLVGNPTSPANHELELNIEMWRVLINQMQRRVEHMEGASPSSITPQLRNKSERPRTP